MKRAIIAATMLLGSVLAAHADHMVFTWHDTIRPHGHKRSDAIGEANVNTCNAQFGAPVDSISPAYADCMRALGYRFVSARLKRAPDGAPDGSAGVCSARILRIEETDWTVDDHPIARMTLRVTPAGGRAYETTVEKPVSILNPPRQGSTLRVSCDPANPTDLHPLN